MGFAGGALVDAESSWTRSAEHMLAVFEELLTDVRSE
jgi:hypothetical protein